MSEKESYYFEVHADTAEQAEVLREFVTMLQAATKDGGHKRAAGTKPSWKIDPSHRAAIFSHLNKDAHGEKVDPDSGAHPLVHLAWRALAVAWQETHPAPLAHQLRQAAEEQGWPVAPATGDAAEVEAWAKFARRVLKTGQDGKLPSQRYAANRFVG